MLVVIYTLILFFTILIISQIFLAFSRNSVMEGFGFQTTPTAFSPVEQKLMTEAQQNASTAAPQNAGNIQAIKQASSQYQPYDPNNAFILAQQNAGNIEVLKQQIEDLSPLSKEVQDISGNVAQLQTQMNSMAAAQQQYAQQMLPSKTPTITGAVNS